MMTNTNRAQRRANAKEIQLRAHVHACDHAPLKANDPVVALITREYHATVRALNAAKVCSAAGGHFGLICDCAGRPGKLIEDGHHFWCRGELIGEGPNCYYLYTFRATRSAFEAAGLSVGVV